MLLQVNLSYIAYNIIYYVRYFHRVLVLIFRELEPALNSLLQKNNKIKPLYQNNLLTIYTYPPPTTHTNGVNESYYLCCVKPESHLKNLEFPFLNIISKLELIELGRFSEVNS